MFYAQGGDAAVIGQENHRPGNPEQHTTAILHGGTFPTFKVIFCLVTFHVKIEKNFWILQFQIKDSQHVLGHTK